MKKKRSVFYPVKLFGKQGKIIPLLVLLVLVLVGVYFLLPGVVQPVLNYAIGERLVPIYYVDTADKKVAFSFDAC